MAREREVAVAAARLMLTCGQIFSGQGFRRWWGCDVSACYLVNWRPCMPLKVFRALQVLHL